MRMFINIKLKIFILSIINKITLKLAGPPGFLIPSKRICNENIDNILVNLVDDLITNVCLQQKTIKFNIINKSNVINKRFNRISKSIDFSIENFQNNTIDVISEDISTNFNSLIKELLQNFSDDDRFGIEINHNDFL